LDLKTINILIIEDNPDDRNIAEEVFEKLSLKYKLFFAEDGIEGMDFLTKSKDYENKPKPSIIFIDINLPKESGIKFLQKIKNDPSLKKIPVVVLTTSDNKDDIDSCYSNYANCYIKKPLDFNRFKYILEIFEKFWFDIVILPED